jgi:hypothetical protein
MNSMILALGLLLSATSFAQNSCEIVPGSPQFIGDGHTQLEAAKESNAACEDYKDKNKVAGLCVINNCLAAESMWTCKADLVACK